MIPLLGIGTMGRKRGSDPDATIAFRLAARSMLLLHGAKDTESSRTEYVHTSLIIPCDASAAVLVSTMASCRQKEEEVGRLSLLTGMIVMRIFARYEDDRVGSDGKHCCGCHKATVVYV